MYRGCLNRKKDLKSRRLLYWASLNSHTEDQLSLISKMHFNSRLRRNCTEVILVKSVSRLESL
ncbi:Hypothetical predicted protein, partial [Mytilus galloprovincialis]